MLVDRLRELVLREKETDASWVLDSVTDDVGVMERCTLMESTTKSLSASSFEAVAGSLGMPHVTHELVQHTLSIS